MLSNRPATSGVVVPINMMAPGDAAVARDIESFYKSVNMDMAPNVDFVKVDERDEYTVAIRGLKDPITAAHFMIARKLNTKFEWAPIKEMKFFAKHRDGPVLLLTMAARRKLTPKRKRGGGSRHASTLSVSSKKRRGTWKEDEDGEGDDEHSGGSGSGVATILDSLASFIAPSHKK